MKEFQQLVEAGEDFNVRPLIKKHKIGVGLVSTLKRLGYIDYENLPNGGTTDKKILVPKITKAIIEKALIEINIKGKEISRSRRDKSKITPATAIGLISASDIYKVSEFLKAFKSKYLLKLEELEELVIQHNLPKHTVNELGTCDHLSTMQDDALGLLYKFKHSVVEPHMARKLLTSILREEPGFSFNKKEDKEPGKVLSDFSTDDINIKTIEVTPTEAGNYYSEPKEIMKEREFTAEEARGIYKLFPELRDVKLKDYTDEELGIDTFPKTWTEIANRLETLQVDAFVDDRQSSEIMYPTEEDKLATTAENKLRWIAYYFNSLQEEPKVSFAPYYDYASEDIRIINVEGKITTEIVFYSESMLERSLTEHSELWNAYYKL